MKGHRRSERIDWRSLHLNTNISNLHQVKVSQRYLKGTTSWSTSWIFRESFIPRRRSTESFSWHSRLIWSIGSLPLENQEIWMKSLWKDSMECWRPMSWSKYSRRRSTGKEELWVQLQLWWLKSLRGWKRRLFNLLVLIWKPLLLSMVSLHPINLMVISIYWKSWNSWRTNQWHWL